MVVPLSIFVLIVELPSLGNIQSMRAHCEAYQLPKVTTPYDSQNKSR